MKEILDGCRDDDLSRLHDYDNLYHQYAVFTNEVTKHRGEKFREARNFEGARYSTLYSG